MVAIGAHVAIFNDIDQQDSGYDKVCDLPAVYLPALLISWLAVRAAKNGRKEQSM
jgi:hypothetical protein